MANRGKLFMITGMVLCLSLVTLCGCHGTGKMVESIVQHASREETETESSELDPFNGIDASMAIGTVNLIQGDSYSIDISRTENCKIIYKVKDKTLKIREEIEDNKAGSATLTIKVPKDAALKVADITIDVGDLSADGLSIKKLIVEQATGDCNITSCDADRIDVSGDVSDVVISNSTENASYSLSTDVGDIYVNGKKKKSPFKKDGGKKSVTVAVSVGDITVE